MGLPSRLYRVQSKTVQDRMADETWAVKRNYPDLLKVREFLTYFHRQNVPRRLLARVSGKLCDVQMLSESGFVWPRWSAGLSADPTSHLHCDTDVLRRESNHVSGFRAMFDPDGKRSLL